MLRQVIATGDGHQQHRHRDRPGVAAAQIDQLGEERGHALLTLK